jgi:hypothetical protein
LDQLNTMAGDGCDSGGCVVGGVTAEAKTQLGLLALPFEQPSVDRMGLL